jgi:hypothetical protein
MCKTRVSSFEPWWLTLVDIVGFEGEENSDDSDDSSDDDDSEDESEEESEDESEEESEDEEESEEGAPVTQKDIKNLKSALRKERIARKRAEREVKSLKSRKPPVKKPAKDESGEGEEEEDKGPSEREVRLATRLRDQALDQVITRYASRMNFVDLDDVLRLVNRKDIDVSQDEDDPTEVDIDEEGVEDALKELAKKKKYLVNANGSRQPRSGSKMSGKGKKQTGATDDELREKYRALR